MNARMSQVMNVMKKQPGEGTEGQKDGSGRRKHHHGEEGQAPCGGHAEGRGNAPAVVSVGKRLVAVPTGEERKEE